MLERAAQAFEKVRHEELVQAKVLDAEVRVVPGHNVQLCLGKVPRQLPGVDAVQHLRKAETRCQGCD